MTEFRISLSASISNSKLQSNLQLSINSFSLLSYNCNRSFDCQYACFQTVEWVGCVDTTLTANVAVNENVRIWNKNLPIPTYTENYSTYAVDNTNLQMPT